MYFNRGRDLSNVNNNRYAIITVGEAITMRKSSTQKVIL
jgi:hypothetical protein